MLSHPEVVKWALGDSSARDSEPRGTESFRGVVQGSQTQVLYPWSCADPGIIECRWRFHLQELSDGHWVSVARGPPENIVDAWQEFTGTLQEPIIPTSRFQVSWSGAS